MGDTGLCVDPNTGALGSQWFAPTNTAGDTCTFTVPLNPPTDLEPFSNNATAIRFIVTACGRYPQPHEGAAFPDNSFPVAMVEGFPAGPPWPPTFKIRARNTDSAAQGGYASFMWLAIAEDPTGIVRPGKPLPAIPRSQAFSGQAAPFPGTGNAGDHQAFPNLWNPRTQNPFLTQGLYNFNGTFGPGPWAAPTGGQPTYTSLANAEPLVFATANNVGWGIEGAPQRNAAAVARVQAQIALGAPDITPQGFRLLARNSDAAGACGFNWIAFKQTQPGTDVLVDTGQLPPVGNLATTEFEFSPVGHDGDWASAEIQFDAPFSTAPVVLITPRTDDPLLGASCAPVPIAQNVTRFGFTLAARNTDTNANAASANFDWVAIGN
jgi:hypothetical protein